MYGYIDRNGRYLIKPKYVYAAGFVDGIAMVAPYGEPDIIGYINVSGEWLIEPQFVGAGNFYHGQ